MTTILIAPMQPSDWPDVRSIYADGIATGNATFETQIPLWEAWDVGHIDGCRFVARIEDKMVGWAALSRVSTRAVYAGVAEVSVYVSEGSRGKGVGKQLLSRLVDASEAAGYWTLQASIFPENVASIRLHERGGFRVVGRREKIGCLHGVWRDTVSMERRRASAGK